MPTEIYNQLNRVFAATITAADVGAFVAIELESRQANAIYLDGLDASVVVADAADRTAFLYHRIFLIKNLRLIADAPIATQVPAPFGREVIAAPVKAGLDSIERDFEKPIILEPGYIYTIYHQYALSAAQTGDVFVHLGARGRMMQEQKAVVLPRELRGNPEEEVLDGVGVPVSDHLRS
jgi:hypothetical protein